MNRLNRNDGYSEQEQLQIERRLLPQRLLVFIGIATILFLVFAALDQELHRIAVATAGFLCQSNGTGHFVYIKRRMDKIDGGKGWFSGRSLALVLSSILLCLWAFLLVTSILELNNIGF